MSDRQEPSGPMAPDEFQIWTRAELARIDQLHADADRKRQELQIAPWLLRAEAWKVGAAMTAAAATLMASGAAIATLIFKL